MMRSLYSGVAGLKTHQTKMDVIGNNIANVNTTAFKSQSITFGDLLYQTTQSASGANAATGAGGTNARQIGLGSKTGAISTAISTQGSAQTTNNPFDIMITGDSFFVVNNGSDNFFTRDGSFAVDGVGNLVMASTGYTVMGWQANEQNEIIRDTVTPLKIMTPENMTFPPAATTKGYISGILDKNDVNVTDPKGKIMSLSFFDKLGYQYNAKFSIHAINASEGQYYVKLDDIIGSDGKSVENAAASFGETISYKSVDPYTKSSIPQDGLYVSAVGKDGTVGVYLKTDMDGDTPKDTATNQITGLTPDGTDDKVYTFTTASKIQSILEMYGLDPATSDVYKDKTISKITYDGETGGIKVEYSATSANSAYLKYDPDKGTFDGIGTTTSVGPSNSKISLKFGAQNFSEIELDFSTTSMFNNNKTSTIGAERGDADGNFTGRKLGEMSGVSISKDGLITAAYDNGQTRTLGQIAVASFSNPAGLEKAGDNLYSATLNSGEFDGIGVDVTEGGGYMTTGVLEMSNVDLAGQFTDMITTQRGFQANSRIITTSDSMLEELVNLKR